MIGNIGRLGATETYAQSIQRYVAEREAQQAARQQGTANVLTAIGTAAQSIFTGLGVGPAPTATAPDYSNLPDYGYKPPAAKPVPWGLIAAGGIGLLLIVGLGTALIMRPAGK